MASLFAAFEDVERLVARTVTEAASAVVESTNEFPKPTAEGARHGTLVPVSTARAASQAKRAETSWEDFDWQDQQVAWQDALQQLQDTSTAQVTAAQLSAQLQELYEQLLSLPDPLPALKSAAALTAKTQELESSNRSLQQQVNSLQQDQSEVTQLLTDFRAEQAAHSSLKSAHTTLQEELAAVKAASGDAQQLQQQVQEQTSTIRSLQASLASMRAELESSQTSLFDLMAKQEQAAGSASTAEQMAVEQMERLSLELLVLRKEKALLERQLQQQQQQEQQQREQRPSQAGDAGDSSTPSGTAAAAADGWDGDWGDANGQSAPAAAGTGAAVQQQQHGAAAAAADAQLAAAEAALAAAQEASRDQEHQIALLTTKLSAADARLERLTNELQRRPAASAVAAMAEQLAALSALTGKQLESEGWNDEAAAAAVAAVAADPVEQLQPLLKERCTKLERALQASKSEAAAACQSASTATEEVKALQQLLQQSQELVRQLEADLLALSSSSSSNGGNSGTATLSNGAPGAGAGAAFGLPGGLEGLVPGSTAAADADPTQQAGTNVSSALAGKAAAGAAAGDGDAASAVLQAVTAQRDRFRARIGELEAEQAGLSARLQQATAQVDTVTRDNVALVEKIRFLERYKHGQGLAASDRQGSVTVIRVDGAGVIHDVTPGLNQGLNPSPSPGDVKGSRYSCGPLSLELPGQGGSRGSSGRSVAATGGGSRHRQRQAGCFGMLRTDDSSSAAAAEAGEWQGPEARYMKEYEARLNPFAEFQASESEARLRGMRLHDKALLAGSRLIAGSKLARAGIALYVLLLHAVIMALMYYSATPHLTLYESSGSSSVPSVVAAAQAMRASDSLAGAAAAAAEELQRTAAANSNGGARLLLRALSLRPVLPYL